MVTAYNQLDKRFEAWERVATTPAPPRGWIKAVREALGMSTTQLAKRLGLSQSRIVRLEKSEVERTVTLETLDRAARALGCRVVYALVPEKSLGTTVLERANRLADRQLASVEQTMRLEDQAVEGNEAREEARRQLVAALLSRPARLWDDL